MKHIHLPAFRQKGYGQNKGHEEIEEKLFLKGQIKQQIKVALMKPALCAFLRS